MSITLYKYCDLRNQLFADIATFIVNFDTLCLEDKFLLLFGSHAAIGCEFIGNKLCQ